MTHDEILKLAKYNLITWYDSGSEDYAEFLMVLELFASACCEWQKERDVAICSTCASEYGTDSDGWYAARECEENIRNQEV